MGKWAQYRHRGRSTLVSPAGITPPEGDACYEIVGGGEAVCHFTLTGGYPPGEHFVTVEAQSQSLGDSAFGTGASDAGSVDTDPFPFGAGVDDRARFAFTNSDGSVLHSAWSPWVLLEEC